ncbi:MAG: hypothetical protein HY331_14440 [Chloroflexi bacterium]|nr:hypothetical protein [Chloroflexota bacterium]
MGYAPLYCAELCGNSRQRGIQHGRLLTAPIERAVEFYRWLLGKHLGLSPMDMRRRAARYVEPTARVSAMLMAEYEGIAEGSGQTIEDIFALSARYEITFEAVRLGECSNVFVGPRRSQEGHTLLGQNWDWRPEVLDFRAVLIARCDDQPDHVVVTECGQPGKYGFNSAGLGVAGAGLSCSGQTSIGENLAVAVIRSMLEKTSFAEARTVIHRHPLHATVTLLLADAAGNAVDFEAAPHGIAEQELRPDEVYWHTNHCRQIGEPCTFENSLVRGRRWAELTESAGPISAETLRGWLADTANAADSICKAPDPAQAGAATWLQTLCSIVMDLNTRTMWVSDGLSSIQPYRRFACNTSSESATRST